MPWRAQNSIILAKVAGEGVGDAEMQRKVAALADGAIGVDDDGRVDALGADDHVVKAVVVEDAEVTLERVDHEPHEFGMVVGRQALLLLRPNGLVGPLHHAAFVHSDADGHAALAACGDDAIDLLAVLDVARVEPNLVDPGLDGFEGPLKMEMHVGDDRHWRLRENRRQGLGVALVRYGDPDDVAPGLGQASYLGDGGVDVVGIGAGHGLNGHRRVAPDGHAADHEFSCFPAGKHVEIVRHGVRLVARTRYRHVRLQYTECRQ